MSTFDLIVRVLVVFIFNNRGPSDVIPVALAAITLWSAIASIYVAVFAPEPYPKFFGVPARQAHWQAQPFPRTWIALAVMFVFVWVLVGGRL